MRRWLMVWVLVRLGMRVLIRPEIFVLLRLPVNLLKSMILWLGRWVGVVVVLRLAHGGGVQGLQGLKRLLWRRLMKAWVVRRRKWLVMRMMVLQWLVETPLLHSGKYYTPRKPSANRLDILSARSLRAPTTTHHELRGQLGQ